MKVSVKQIALFVAIAKQGNLSKAAASLHITQAAASMALADLENQLAVKLFDRFGKKLVINVTGQALLPKAINILESIQEFEHQAINTAGLSGELKIGASTTIAHYLLPKLISQFAQKYPETKVSLEVGNTEHIIEKMRHFQLDMGFIEGLCNVPELIAEGWLQDSLLCFVRAGHPWLKQPLSYDTLSNAQWVLRERGSGTREIFERSIFNKLSQLNIMLELGSAEAIKQAVLNSNAIGCLSALTLEAELNSQRLVKLDLPGLEMPRDLLLITHQAKTTSALVQEFKRMGQAEKIDKPRLRVKAVVV